MPNRKIQSETVERDGYNFHVSLYYWVEGKPDVRKGFYVVVNRLLPDAAPGLLMFNMSEQASLFVHPCKRYSAKQEAIAKQLAAEKQQQVIDEAIKNIRE